MLLAVAGAVVLPRCAVRAQGFDQYLTPIVPGYDRERGAEILQRPRTEYDPLGVREGEFTIRPRLDEAISYNSNVLATRPAIGSWAIGTIPQVDIISDFSRNSLGASAGINDIHYLDQKSQTYTDWNVSLGGTYQIGNDSVTVGGSEVYQHETVGSIDSSSIIQPLGYKVTDLRARYSTSFLRWQFEPNVNYIGYRFDDQTLPGDKLSQKVRDRDVYVAGLTTRFGDWPERSLVLVLRAIDTIYVADLGGAPRPNSIGYEGLIGTDYAFSGNLQLLFLVGYEVRRFAGGVYPTRSSPVLDSALIWAPSGLTTLTARASRTIEDSIGETTTGVTLTSANLTIDHEYRRNWLLQGRAAVDLAEFGQGMGRQTLYNLSASATYAFNRNLRVKTSYGFTARTGSSAGQTTILQTPGAMTSVAGDYNAHVVIMDFQFSL